MSRFSKEQLLLLLSIQAAQQARLKNLSRDDIDKSVMDRMTTRAVNYISDRIIESQEIGWAHMTECNGIQMTPAGGYLELLNEMRRRNQDKSTFLQKVPRPLLPGLTSSQVSRMPQRDRFLHDDPRAGRCPSRGPSGTSRPLA